LKGGIEHANYVLLSNSSDSPLPGQWHSLKKYWHLINNIKELNTIWPSGYFVNLTILYAKRPDACFIKIIK